MGRPKKLENAGYTAKEQIETTTNADLPVGENEDEATDQNGSDTQGDPQGYTRSDENTEEEAVAPTGIILPLERIVMPGARDMLGNEIWLPVDTRSPVPADTPKGGAYDPLSMLDDYYIAGKNTKLLIKRLSHAVGQPPIAYQSTSAAGLDLYAAIPTELMIKPGGRAQISTGLCIELPVGYEGQVRPRSSLAWKDGITVINSPGTIDADYRGEVKILLLNTSNNMYRVQPGARIAQLVIAPVVQVEIEYVDELTDTQRGSGGFGSTGM